MQLPNSTIGKERVTYCTPVFVEVARELRSRSKAYLLIYSLLTSLVPGCRPGCRSQNMHSYCRWLWWWRTSPCTNNAPIIFVWHLAKLSITVSIYRKHLLPPLTWAVRMPSRYDADSSLPKAIRASHIVVSACATFPECHFPAIAFFYLKCHASGFGWWQWKQS